MLLAALAPFETLDPVVRLPWQSISNVELAIVVAVAAWGASLAVERTTSWWRTPLTAPWAALLATMLASSLFAPAWRANALHMTGRMAAAMAIFLMTAAGTGTMLRVRRLLEVAALAGAAVAVCAIFESLGIRTVVDALRVFRANGAVVGEQVRASGTLQYPTIASMYLEIAFAFAIGLLAAARESLDARGSAWWGAVALVVAEGIVVTFTRAGLVTMAGTLALVAIVWLRQGRRRGGVPAAIALVAAGIVLEVAASHAPAATRLRMTTEMQDAWYRAEIVAPRQVALGVDETVGIPIVLTNTGRVEWSSASTPPFSISYHWVMPDDDRVVAYEGLRTPFASTIAPGATTSVTVAVRAPRRPGRYRLVWDIAEEGRLWFSTEPGAALSVSRATVAGMAAGPPDAGPLRLLPRPQVRPGRMALWRAAAKMIAAHLMLGVGPDNYRLSYGSYLGIGNADPRVHTNNMYLEIAVGAGIAGAIALAWLLVSAFRVFRDVAVTSDSAGRTVTLGIAAAGLAILVHGFVDTFLGFTPVYVLIAITLGLAAGSRRAGESDAHRV